MIQASFFLDYFPFHYITTISTSHCIIPPHPTISHQVDVKGDRMILVMKDDSLPEFMGSSKKWVHYHDWKR